MGIITKFLSLVGFGNKTDKKQSLIQRAKKIEIIQLVQELKLLEEHKTDFDFIGITSNGNDCIYFVKDDEKFQIEFEAIVKEQIPYIEKLKEFAKQNEYEISYPKLVNKTNYGTKNEQILRIITNSDIENTAKIAQQIQKNVFNNQPGTLYEIVP